MGKASADTNILIVGGGPAGLTAAIAARKAGFEVAVMDRSRPPIDKACGEGLMPDGVAALREIGVELDAKDGAPFRGIRFIDGPIEAGAVFPGGGFGIGMRRTRLHEALISEAERTGVVLRWQTAVSMDNTGAVTAEDRQIRFDWLIGADGVHSRVRRSAGSVPNRRQGAGPESGSIFVSSRGRILLKFIGAIIAKPMSRLWGRTKSASP